MSNLQQEKIELRADMLQEDYLRSDFQAFYDFTEKQREEAVKAIKHLRDLHKMYGYFFDIRELGDEL